MKIFQTNGFLFLLGLFITKLAIAHSFEWRAALLYLKPTIDDSHYVLSSFDNTFKGSLFPKGKRHQNCASFNPGFSLEGLYDIDPGTSCLDLRLIYFKACSTDSVSGDFLYDTNGFPGFGAQASPIYAGTAQSKNSYNFYAGDLTYNRTFTGFFTDHLTFIVGLHVAYIKFNEQTTSSGTFINHQKVKPLSNNLERHSQFCGIGPQFGLDYQFLLSRFCFFPGKWALTAKTRGSLLCGNTKSDLSYVTLRTGPGGVGVKNGDLWRIIPSVNAELGMNYTLNCQCLSLTVEFGYEFIWYSECVNKVTGLDVAFAGNTIDVFNNFSLHGPYLRLSSAF